MTKSYTNGTSPCIWRGAIYISTGVFCGLLRVLQRVFLREFRRVLLRVLRREFRQVLRRVLKRFSIIAGKARGQLRCGTPDCDKEPCRQAGSPRKRYRRKAPRVRHDEHTSARSASSPSWRYRFSINLGQFWHNFSIITLYRKLLGHLYFCSVPKSKIDNNNFIKPC